ncbi:hypothetical protein JMUB7522_26690 [Staphylococcus aureus]
MQRSLVGFFKQKTAYEMQRSLVGSEMCIRDSIGTDSIGSLIKRFAAKKAGVEDGRNQ